jgi:hypothetical protein
VQAVCVLVCIHIAFVDEYIFRLATRLEEEQGVGDEEDCITVGGMDM